MPRGVSTSKMLKRRNKLPVQWHYAKWLVASSFSFTIVTFYTFYMRKLWPYGVLSLIISVISAMYWADTKSDTKRKSDLIVAKGSFFLYFISGCFFVRDTFLLMIGVPILCSITGCYYMSLKAFEEDKPYWHLFHMAFHLFVALEQLVVVHAGVEMGFN